MKSELIECALKMADTARELTMQGFNGKPIKYIQKKDKSPQTQIDVSCEEALCSIAKELTPKFGIFSEEHERSYREDNFNWIIDPIDGTKSFITGVPLFATLIALTNQQGQVVLGIVEFPALERRLIAYQLADKNYKGYFIDRTRCIELKHTPHTNTNKNGKPTLANSTLAYTNLSSESANKVNKKKPAVVRAGADAFNYALVALGQMDCALDEQMKIYDYAAFIPLFGTVGGYICDHNGKNFIFEQDSLDSNKTVIAARNEALALELCETLA